MITLQLNMNYLFKRYRHVSLNAGKRFDKFNNLRYGRETISEKGLLPSTKEFG